MARRSNTDERRGQIVAALQAVMARAGYAGATIAAIARHAELTPGLVHYHFRDKREILVALVDSLAGYAQQRYESRAAAAHTAGQRLQAYIAAHLAYGSDAQPDAVAAWVMIGEQSVHDPDVREVYQAALATQMKLLKGLLRQCYAERGRRVRQLDALVAGITCFIQGAFTLSTTARQLLPTAFAAPTLIDWVERYMDAQEQR
ncbi:TetR family transcriptional regulator [Pseudomonas sp. TKO26]|uniref:TetR family transcriptional regulator n=1 Tax=unclassified Pseudomonas TaxID=196821 RepID=UPI000D82AD39|nr:MULTISPECIES: TetR family transcriptional regulator [unclassified Pseudomonas]PYY84809.1 TetR family transcriptional regulator [Pseudomonas sp. TKO30]PYY86717.1 TetR family transcriptional regulator [Pseudomonas sp. TKO29]PYY89360.1 TetR family transcriptional regulator [Pseudomonas sp. TKO26]PYY99189.1 TetR family transcriptional regulator [Pseudomonas sp. TKO14]